MKRIWSVIVIFTLVLLGGCSSENNTQASSSKDEQSEISIYLMRHGKTMLNTVDRSQGWIDAPLTPAGIEVAESVGESLGKEVSFDKVYSSDSGRAIETAEIVMDVSGQELPINKDKRLREFNFGTFEGMMNEEMWEAIASYNGQTMEEFMGGMSEGGFAEGIKLSADSLAALDSERVDDNSNWPAEDYQTIAKRLKEGLDEIIETAQKNQEKEILVVSHGMSIVSLLITLDPTIVDQIPPTGLSNASISKIVYQDGQYTVESVNDTSYAE
jgi:broad specificity phosphatase PhoE